MSGAGDTTPPARQMNDRDSTTKIVSLTPFPTRKKQREYLQAAFGEITCVDHGFMLPRNPQRAVAELEERVRFHNPDVIVLEIGSGTAGSVIRETKVAILAHPTFSKLTILNEVRMHEIEDDGIECVFGHYEVLSE